MIGRLIEVKHEMVNHDLKMFQFHDEMFSDLKMTPADFVIHVPHYITHDRREELSERNAKLDLLIQYMGGDDFNGNSR